MPSLGNEQLVPTIELLETESEEKMATRMPSLFQRSSSINHRSSPISKVVDDSNREPSYPPRPIRELNSTLWDYSGCQSPVLLDRNDGKNPLLFLVPCIQMLMCSMACE